MKTSRLTKSTVRREPRDPRRRRRETPLGSTTMKRVRRSVLRSLGRPRSRGSMLWGSTMMRRLERSRR